MISLNKLVKQLLSSYLIFLQLSVSSAHNEGRIVGGYSTDIGYAPYLVQIRNGDQFLCGGTLVTRRHVVTAAHCFGNNPQDLIVIGGATRLYDDGDARSHVVRYIIPEDYTADGLHMDIAVIILKTILKGGRIQPISYNCKQDWTVGQTVTLFGWGLLNENTTTVSIDLQSVEVKVVNKTNCANTFLQIRLVTESMVCAAAFGKDACSGDSGGPAIIKRQFCGVISWGNGCGQQAYPGVYTNVNAAKDFIKESIKLLK